MIKVAKFGGSSLSDAAQFRKVKEIIHRDPSRVVIAVSAPGKRGSDDHKVTDLLYLIHAHLTYGVDASHLFAQVRERFLLIRDELKLTLDLETDFEALSREMKSGISLDKLVSRGEYFSAKLLASFLGCQFTDASNLIVFHLDGSIDTETSYERIRAALSGRKTVVPGFYGAMPDGSIHLMSRGGSDITGSLLAAALNVDVYENWTDVSGILMTDPKIVPDAKPIPRMTYLELRELSYIGAKVLHENSIFPVREKDIPINIRNTNDPDHPGTFIQEAFAEDQKTDQGIVTGIAGKKGFTAITILKIGLSSMVGALRQILGVFAKYNVTIAYTSSGIDCISLIVEETILSSAKYAIISELDSEFKPDKISISDPLAVLAVVGRRMVQRAGSSARIFSILGKEKINVRMISQGPEELNVIVAVDEKDYSDAVRAIYEQMVR